MLLDRWDGVDAESTFNREDVGVEKFEGWRDMDGGGGMIINFSLAFVLSRTALGRRK